MHLGGLVMGLTKIRLGDYIERSTINNKDLKYGTDLIVGVNSQGVFAHPKGNTDGVDLKPYKIVENGAFVYNPTRLELGSIAYRTDGLCIVSHLYMVFYLTNEGKKIINPMWLYMYFRRSEFCREVTFRNFENQKNYERGLEDLKVVCDVYIEELRKEMPHKKLGNYISLCDEKNDDLVYSLDAVRGISIEKRFIYTKANMEGVSLKPYAVVKPDEFAYVTVTSRNGEKISLARNDSDETYICSSSYIVFKVDDTNTLLPAYLSMLFERSEFNRYSRFNSWGSARETFDWEEMKNVLIPIPNIEIQQDIVNIFEAYNTRRDISEKFKAQIKDICPILIKGSIEEGRKAKEA